MAAKAELKAFLGLNSKEFQKGLARARAQANDFAKKGMKVGAAAVVTFGAAMVVGTKKAIGLGAELQHIKQQTGLAVKENMVLSRTFRDAGVSAKDLGRRVQEMQRNLVEAERGTSKAAEALDDLGLSASDLINMDPSEQMRLISEALLKIENPARRSAMAIAIMGTRGAEMIKSMDPAALDDARKSLGKMPEIMDRFAGAFERADTIMGRLPDKATGFFTGFAGEVVGSILGPLEEVNELDFTELGQRLGRAIAPWIEAIKGGEIWELFTLHGERAVGQFSALLMDGFGNAGITAWAAMAGVMEVTAERFGDVLVESIARAAEAMEKLMPSMKDELGLEKDAAFEEAARQLRAEGKGGFMGSLRNKDIAERRREILDQGEFPEIERNVSLGDRIRGDRKNNGISEAISDAVARSIADAPVLNFGQQIKDTYDPEIQRLMAQLQARVAANNANAEGIGGGDGDGDDGKGGGRTGPRHAPGSLFGNITGTRSSSEASGEKTDFWRVVERDLGGAITNWDELSDRQKEKFAHEAPAEEQQAAAIRSMGEDEDSPQSQRAQQERQGDVLQKILQSLEEIRGVMVGDPA